jgi:hypothetical protein
LTFRTESKERDNTEENAGRIMFLIYNMRRFKSISFYEQVLGSKDLSMKNSVLRQCTRQRSVFS